MDLEPLRLIALIGLNVQLVGSLLLVVLFFLLLRNVSRRAWFAQWAWAWAAVSVAIGALELRYLLTPIVGPIVRGDRSVGTLVLYFVYQLGKLGFFGFLLSGAATYAAGVRVRRWVSAALVAGAVYAAASVALSPELDGVVVWQAPVAIAAFALCSMALLRMPASRRTLGSELTGTVFGLGASLWALYAGAFGTLVYGGTTGANNPVFGIVRYNSFIDLLVQVLLGFGMVVMLMEDAKRVVDDAHAQLAIAHDQLRRDALLDPLTGALNRRAFGEGVGLAAAKAAFGSVAMLDLDNLKTVNDSLGHAAGDVLLRHVVVVLRAALRPSDRIYRWGGDEFLLVLEGARAADVRARVEATLRAAPATLDASGVALGLAASFGVADYVGAEQLMSAIEQADAEMYRHKRRRRSGELAAIPVG